MLNVKWGEEVGGECESVSGGCCKHSQRSPHEVIARIPVVVRRICGGAGLDVLICQRVVTERKLGRSDDDLTI